MNSATGPSDCGSVHQAISTLAQNLSMAAWSQDLMAVGRLLGEVQSVRRNLQEHVALMESIGGLYDCIGCRCPHLMRDIERLSRQHAGLDQQLSELESRLAGHTPEDPTHARSIRQGARQLLSAIREHEQRGNVLVMDAYCTDMGVAG